VDANDVNYLGTLFGVREFLSIYGPERADNLSDAAAVYVAVYRLEDRNSAVIYSGWGTKGRVEFFIGGGGNVRGKVWVY
jgi:hypothetical protein